MLRMVTSSATRLWDPGFFDVQCLSAIKFLSTTWVSCLFVPDVKDYLGHGLELSAATQQDPGIRHFILLPCYFLGKPGVCAGTVVHLGNTNFVVTVFEYLQLWDKGNSILIQVTAVFGTFGALTCTYKRTYYIFQEGNGTLGFCNLSLELGYHLVARWYHLVATSCIHAFSTYLKFIVGWTVICNLVIWDTWL